MREKHPHNLTVSEAVDSYLTFLLETGSRSCLDARSVLRCHILTAFSGLQLRNLQPEFVEAWILSMRARGAAAKSIRSRVSWLSSVCEHAIKSGALEVNPVRLLPRGTLPNAAPRDRWRASLEVLQLHQVCALMTSPKIPFHRRLLWSLLLLTGMRIGEASALKWNAYSNRETPLGQIKVAFSYSEKTGEITGTKTGEIRYVPTHPALAETLSVAVMYFKKTFQRNLRPTDLVCPFKKPGRQPAHWKEKTALRWWHKDLLRLGIEHPPSGPRRLHATRHTFCSQLVRAGVPRELATAFTHTESDRSSAALYTHPDWPTLCAVILKLKI